MPRLPLESTEHFTWPGNLNGWPTTKLIIPIIPVKEFIKEIEEKFENPPPVKVWESPMGFIMVRDPVNQHLADAYRFLRFSYIPIQKMTLPPYDANKVYPREILDYVPIRQLPKTNHEEDPL